MNILFLTHAYPNYVPDLLLHGLRKLLGEHVVDYPRKTCLYEGVLGLGVCPQEQRCPDWFPNDNGQIDRTEIWQKVQKGYFDIVVSDLRAVSQIYHHLNKWPDRCALVDGEDRPQPISPGPFIIFRRETDGSDYSVPLPMALPEEVFNWITKYDGMPKRYGIGFLGSTQNDDRKSLLESLSRIYPDTLFQATEIPSGDNPVPKGRMSRDIYYQQLQQCQMVLSLSGAGFDTFRFWEHAACQAVHLSPWFPLFIPDDFKNNKEIMRFNDFEDLRRIIDGVLDAPQGYQDSIRRGRRKLVHHHLTTHRAAYFLSRIGNAFDGTVGDRISIASAMDHRNSPNHQNSANGSDIYLGLVKGENYGWGVCSRYLIDELPKLRSVHVLNDEDGSTFNPRLNGKLFQALTTVAFEPLFDKARGAQNYGYTFFENELSGQSIDNAKQYDLILAGSTWCRDRLLEKGIPNCDVLIQGIDPKRFHPIKSEKSQDRFVIFSGGKFELRKGQDILLRAVKILQDQYPDIYLVNCWYNLWAESLRQMTSSPYITFSYSEKASWIDTMQRTYQDNGVDASRVSTMEPVPHHQLRSLFKQTDIGVFPNRCEGGTNLVLMEYMACAKPVIASLASGQKDIVTEQNALLLRQLKDINIVSDDGSLIGRWQDPSLDELVAQLEYAYHHRETTKTKARQAGEDLQRFTWKHCAERLVDIIYRSDYAD